MTLASPHVASEERDIRSGHVAETEDPRNALLTAFDAQVEALIANGFELQVRSRLAKHFPELRKPAQPADTQTQVAQELELAGVLAALRVIDNRRMAEAELMLVRTAKDWVKARLEALKSNRRSP